MGPGGAKPRVNVWAEPATVHVLHPGDVAFASRGDRFVTLLGSCVAIILTDPRRTAAAMCHIVHSGTPTVDVNDADTRHAEPAMAAMFALLRGRGISPHLCEAYVYGGGNMFPSLSQQHLVGTKNTDWALNTLDELRIPVVGHDVGGTTYRRVSWTVGLQAPEVRLGGA